MDLRTDPQNDFGDCRCARIELATRLPGAVMTLVERICEQASARA